MSVETFNIGIAIFCAGIILAAWAVWACARMADKVRQQRKPPSSARQPHFDS